MARAAEQFERGQPLVLSTAPAAPELPARAGALPERLRAIARSYLGARRQSGVSLLEAARWLSEARSEAKHGEWAIFLEAIGLDESRARAQIRIHEEAQRDPLFADRIINGFLSETVARELLPLPSEQREELLTRETPPTREEVREAKRAPAPVLEPAPPAPAPDPAHVERLEEQIESGDRIPEAAMEIDDDALIADIRAQAAALGLGVIWEDDTVILHWPGEDVESLLGLGYTDALYWLRTEGRTMAEDRAAAAQPKIPEIAAPPPAHAPMPAVPPRPRRPHQPRSADASAQAEYTAQTELYMDQMDAYARALERVIMALQHRDH